MREPIIFLNGEYLPEPETRVPLADPLPALRDRHLRGDPGPSRPTDGGDAALPREGSFRADEAQRQAPEHHDPMDGGRAGPHRRGADPQERAHDRPLRPSARVQVGAEDRRGASGRGLVRDDRARRWGPTSIRTKGCTAASRRGGASRTTRSRAGPRSAGRTSTPPSPRRTRATGASTRRSSSTRRATSPRGAR